ncbi:hypothetical protein [Arthrobacter ramosus]|uniref:ATP-binding protein n=1 Tax=Arthrobacter ramosus TaxID=1672 RepID=A0ABV5XYC0_ARTRM|nr:hypothetical protein [Arthrobacter ramosus]
MNPRPGGEADKIGNRYEGAWTVARMLDVLAGRGESVRVEPIGELGSGVEFIFKRSDGTVEAHQVKRQVGVANEWSYGQLNSRGVWDKARLHAEAGRDYHFVSMTPFRPLQELTDQIRNSSDYSSFILTTPPEKSNTLFVKLGNHYGSPENAYRILGRIYVRTIDEIELAGSNAVFAEMLLEGSPGAQCRAVLGEILDDSFDRDLTAQRILGALHSYGLRSRLAASQRGLADKVSDLTAKWIGQTGSQLIQPVIHREEADQLRSLMTADERAHFVVGVAGGGKTGVLHEATQKLVEDGVPVLVFRLDRCGSLSSAAALGEQLGLGMSPVAALAAAADGHPAFLVVDQVDAVSLVSGRLPDNFEVVAELVLESAAIPNLHVVLVTRQFDVENDYRIRRLRDRRGTSVLSIPPLSDGQVDRAVEDFGLPATTLTPLQRDILRVPLHLALLATIADEANALGFVNSLRLFDAYWERKLQSTRRENRTVRFAKVVGRVAQVISERQELSVPLGVLDDEDLALDASILVSEQVLIRDRDRIAFFHEGFFDYAFARQWLNRGQTLLGFLWGDPQELFRRGQVRQILVHLRSSEPQRFLDEVTDLLESDQIRFHIKDACLGVLGALTDPNSSEARLAVEIARDSPELRTRLWDHTRTPVWFERLDSDGYVADWLQGGHEDQRRAMELMGTAAKTMPDRLAVVLQDHRNAEQYPAWLRWIVRFADLGASQRLVEVLLQGIREGCFDDNSADFWFVANQAGTRHPQLGLDLVSAFLIDRPGSLEPDANGRIGSLKSSDYFATGVVRHIAAADPLPFCHKFLPYALKVMAATADPEVAGEGPIPDAHFCNPFSFRGSNTDLDDFIFTSLSDALAQLAVTDPEEIRPLLATLAADPHAGAQRLLYEALKSNGPEYADMATSVLLEGRHRLLCGNNSDSVWTTRQLLTAISPHLTDQQFIQLETVISELRFQWERRSPGRPAFSLLSALQEDRLSDVGRRRLGELRRAYGMNQPTKPDSIIRGTVVPPISSDAAGRMDDSNWLRAMGKHSKGFEALFPFRGGAGELAQVLQEQTRLDPDRFARLALQLTHETHPAYANAILLGLNAAGDLGDPSMVFAAVRHIASLGHAETDQLLGMALRPHLKVAPLDIVDLLCGRVIAAAAAVRADPPAVATSEERVDDESGRDIWTRGLSTTRGSLVDVLADLVAHDIDGARTVAAAPAMARLARDPSLPVRACTARLIHASLRYARSTAIDAFTKLIDAGDALFASPPVTRLLVAMGYEDPDLVKPLIGRMLEASSAGARKAGGRLAVLAALEWSARAHLDTLLGRRDPEARAGAAHEAAYRLSHTTDPATAADVLRAMMNDEQEGVQAAAAEMAIALRGHRLQPHEGIVGNLISSAAFVHALPQLLITLERAPDRIDRLVLRCAQRFVRSLGPLAADLSTGAAGDAQQVGRLVVRGLAQSRSTDKRSALLDVLDDLLRIGAYGVDTLISDSERPS